MLQRLHLAQGGRIETQPPTPLTPPTHPHNPPPPLGMTVTPAPTASIRSPMPSNRFATASTATETGLRPPVPAAAAASEAFFQPPCPSSAVRPLKGALLVPWTISKPSSRRKRRVRPKQSRADHFEFSVPARPAGGSAAAAGLSSRCVRVGLGWCARVPTPRVRCLHACPAPPPPCSPEGGRSAGRAEFLLNNSASPARAGALGFGLTFPNPKRALGAHGVPHWGSSAPAHHTHPLAMQPAGGAHASSSSIVARAYRIPGVFALCCCGDRNRREHRQRALHGCRKLSCKAVLSW